MSRTCSQSDSASKRQRRVLGKSHSGVVPSRMLHLRAFHFQADAQIKHQQQTGGVDSEAPQR